MASVLALNAVAKKTDEKAPGSVNKRIVVPHQPNPAAKKFPEPAQEDLSKRLVIPNQLYTLDNGLTVILSEDHTSPFVAASLWYQVGAVNEQPGKTGLAHFFEHMMFGGSVHAKGDAHFKKMEEVGAFSLNATTSFDRTNYIQTVPKSQLELLLALEASRMYFLKIGQAEFDVQKLVVANERRQRYETTPYGLATLKLWQSIFPPNHPMHGLVIGSHEDLEKTTVADLQSFYDKNYGPSNACLTLVGDFNVDTAKGLINKYFGSLPKSPKNPTPLLPNIAIGPQEIIRYPEKLGKLPLIRIQYLTPALFKPGDAELDIISFILTGGEHGRLTKALTRDKALANSVSASQQSFEQLSVFSIDAILNPQVSEKKALKTIDKVLAGLVSNPPTVLEINRARNALLTNQFFGLQELGGYSGRAEALQSYHRFAKDPNFIQKDLARYMAVDQKSVVEAVKKYLPVGKHRKILEAIPEVQQVATRINNHEN